MAEEERRQAEEKEQTERQDNEGLGALTSQELTDIVRSPEIDIGSTEWTRAFNELAERGYR